MKLYIKAFYLIIALLALNACENYDVLVKNPNLPTTVPPALLLTGALEHMNDANAWNGKMGSQSAAQFYVSTYDYYGTNNYDQGPFIQTTNNFEYTKVLQNVVQMELEAINAGQPDVNPYSALAKFLKAFYYNLMSQKLGDVPLTEALLGPENPRPVYDSQKDVYIQILKWLDESNADIASLIASNDATLSGDIYLGNSLGKWQKIVNSFTLRVLISLSKKEADGDLNIKSKFAAIIGDPAKYPVMSSTGDNLQYTYNVAYNPYPKNPTSLGRDGTRENVGSVFMGLATSLKDPRTFVVGTPAPAKIIAGKAFTDFDAYVGAPAGLSMSDLGVNAQGGEYSYINALRYSFDFAGSKAEPAMIIGYPELCFNIAEGINRGWTSGDAGSWYTKGITASMNFLGVTEGSSVTVGNLTGTIVYGSVDNLSIATYLAQPAVAYKSGTDGLNQILNQKYLAFWQNSNWEAFFNQRRTGVPTFSSGPGSGNGNKIAKRWQYPRAEVDSNGSHYSEAVQRQFSGVDDLDGTLWINQ
ncbi:MAG: SusD/RagB family nutrient-binding outer membrane lipoprotein [Chryseolinea sp.]